MVDRKEPRRPYRSALRTEQATRTRQRVYAAAAQTFAECGFGGTTLTAIADAAGVSTETVKNVGAKHALLLGAFEQSFGGERGTAPLEDQLAELMPPEGLSGEQIVDLLVEEVSTSNQRAGRLWIAFLGAAAADPVVADTLAAMLQRRDRDLDTIVALLVDAGWTPHRSARDTAAVIAYYVAPEAHLHFVVNGSWSMTTYRRWMTESIRALFD